jgi:glycosyltransferase involved in cell wall biosynthesis
MPIYNAEKTLKSAIDSILCQTYQNLHLVLVDDFSEDDSLEIAKSYSKNTRVTIIANSKNKGAYYSRNIGLYKFRNHSWGFFTTHDADDISNPNRIEIMHKYLKNNRTVAVQDTWERKKLSNRKSISVSLTCAHAMFKRLIFRDLGYFDMMRFGADWEHWARVTNYCKLNNMLTKSIKEIMGSSYVASTNLTEQIATGSGPRENYVLESQKDHVHYAKIGKIQHRAFSLKMEARSVSDYMTAKAIPQVTITKSEPKNKTYNNVRITVVLLTWQRLGNLKQTLHSLSNQTFQNFEVYISNANLKYRDVVEKNAKRYSEDMKIRVSHDGNDVFAFRRIHVGKKLAQEGTDILLFIDDDVAFDEKYIETFLRYYEPKSYKSGFAWNFQNNGADYYSKRTRVFDTSSVVHYCGTGFSILDSSIFLDDDLENSAPEAAIKIEDLWLSYYAQHVKGWKLGYVPVNNVTLLGADQVALYKTIIQDKKKSSKVMDKADFLRYLIKMRGWKLSTQP